MSAATAPPLHVTFTFSARVSLAQALDRLGRREEILPLGDYLGCGPIDPGTVEQRRPWIDEQLGIDYEDDIAAFWERVTTMRTPIVAWLSSRDANELCGYLELLWRVKDAPVSVVDASDVSLSFSRIRSDVMIDRKLYERITPVTDAGRASHEADWRRLRAENADLRVLIDGRLTSQPITYFDDTIRACITNEWQKCARVVGAALTNLWEAGHQPPGSDHLVFSRLLALIDDETIEGESTEEYWAMSTSRVRRVPAR